jgi:hypothetical protein
LHLAFDLGNRLWKLAFATSIGHAPRLRTMPARDLAQLDAEIAAAKARCGLAFDAPVVSCYEAGRDGCWLHRVLTARGLTSHVVDSASINENRRARRAKSDRLDATALVRLLLRHHGGEGGVWSVLHVPSVDEEDRRHLHRELFTLTRERTRQVNRIKGLLALHGIVLPRLRGLPAKPPALRSAGAQSGRRDKVSSSDEAYGLHEAFPGLALHQQHLPAFGRQTIEAAPTLGGLLDPGSRDPPALLESIEQRI